MTSQSATFLRVASTSSVGANWPRVTRSVALHHIGTRISGREDWHDHCVPTITQHPLRTSARSFPRNFSRLARLEARGALGSRTRNTLEAPISTVSTKAVEEGAGGARVQLYGAGDRRGRACARAAVALAHRRLDQCIGVRTCRAWIVERCAGRRQPSHGALGRGIAGGTGTFRRER